MSSYVLGALLVGIVALLWRYVRRAPQPSQIEPMSRHWLLQKAHHPLEPR
jgi:hypothetical protein